TWRVRASASARPSCCWRWPGWRPRSTGSGGRAARRRPPGRSAAPPERAARAGRPSALRRLRRIRPRVGRGLLGLVGLVVAALLLRPAVAVAAGVVGPGRQVGVGDAMLAALVVLEPHRVLVDLGTSHRQHALAGLELGPRRRQLLMVLAVGGQLVGEAAQQPPARARDLARVERELLL